MAYPKSSFFDAIWFYQVSKSQRISSLRLLRKIKRAKDDRSFVVTSALIVEFRIEQIIRILLPGYDRFLSPRNLSFAQKLKIARATRFVPDKLLEFAIFVRDLRNDFAHDLRYDSLGRINAKRKAQLAIHARSLSSKKLPLKPRKKLEHLVTICFMDLELHRMNAEYFQWAIRRKNFVKFLHSEWPVFEKRRQRYSLDVQ